MREEAYKVKREFLVLLKRCYLRICMLCVLIAPLSQYVQSTYADSFTREFYNGQEVSQKRHVSGIIVDEKGEILIGVTVAVKNGKNMCLTDAEGHFNIWLNSNESTLVISYIGMKTMEVAALHDGPLKIVMKVDDNPLN